MGRHQRRGYVGQTNLPSPHKHTQHEQGPRSVPSTRIERGEAVSPSPQTQSRKRQLRAKWKLDLGPVPRGLEPLHFTRHEREDMPPEVSSLSHRQVEWKMLGDFSCRFGEQKVLAANIEATQQERKSFKDECWYRSPIGAGSKSSVILAALKLHDHTDTGFLPRTRIQETLQHHQFGLSEPEAHALLARYDPTQEQIHYKTFVQQLHFAEPPAHPDCNDIIFRHERYLEKIRDHATRLLDNTGSCDSSSPVRLSPFKDTMVTNNAPTVVLGNSPPRRLPPLADVGESPSPKRTDQGGDDRLSFVHDKERRAQRARAKAAALLAHISRVDAYARHQDVVALQQESLRIAQKAIHHGEHLARIYDEEHHQLYRLEHQGKKVLFASPGPLAQRSVSKDSMFYIDPKDG